MRLGVVATIILALVAVSTADDGPVKNVRLGPPVLIDNADDLHVTVKGAWRAAKSQDENCQGSDFLFIKGGEVARVQFEPELKHDGTYAVFIRHVTMTGSSRKVPVIVHHADGEHTEHLDQRDRSGTWIELGRFPFEAGTSGYVEVDATDAQGIVTADAVVFRRLLAREESEPAPTTSTRPKSDVDPVGEALPQQPRHFVDQAFHNAVVNWSKQVAQQFGQTRAPKLRAVGSNAFVLYTDTTGHDEYLLRQADKLWPELVEVLYLPDDYILWPGHKAIFLFERRQTTDMFGRVVQQGSQTKQGANYIQALSTGTPGRKITIHFLVMTWPIDRKSHKTADPSLCVDQLVRMATAAFLMDHGTDRFPAWYVEGLSGYMAARIEPDVPSAAFWITASRDAVAKDVNLTKLLAQKTFKSAGEGAHEKAVAHGIVRWLHDRDPIAFARFFRLLLKDKAPQEALIKAFGLNYAKLAHRWREEIPQVLDDATDDESEEAP